MSLRSSRRIGWLVVTTVVALLSVTALVTVSSQADDADSGSMVYEMRTYTTNDGKLDALHARFRDHTMRLFEKHGLENVAYWTPMDGDEAGNTLVYIIAAPSREARDSAFAAFLADPEWQKAYAESTADGRLVKKIDSRFLAPTDYSPLK